VCAEQFGVIWAQYQRGPCPRSLSLSHTLSLSLSLLLFLSHSLLEVSVRIQREPRRETERINHEHLSTFHVVRETHSSLGLIHAPCPDGLRNRHIYVIIYIYVRRASSYVMCVCVCVCVVLRKETILIFLLHIYIYIYANFVFAAIILLFFSPSPELASFKLFFVLLYICCPERN